MSSRCGQARFGFASRYLWGHRGLLLPSRGEEVTGRGTCRLSRGALLSLCLRRAVDPLTSLAHLKLAVGRWCWGGGVGRVHPPLSSQAVLNQWRCTGDMLRAFHAALRNSPINTKNQAVKVRGRVVCVPSVVAAAASRHQ